MQIRTRLIRMEYEALYHDSGSNVTPKMVKHNNKSSKVLAVKKFFTAFSRLWRFMLKVNVFYIGEYMIFISNGLLQQVLI